MSPSEHAADAASANGDAGLVDTIDALSWFSLSRVSATPIEAFQPREPVEEPEIADVHEDAEVTPGDEEVSWSAAEPQDEVEQPESPDIDLYFAPGTEDRRVPPGPYGVGSAYAPFDGTAPHGFFIKGTENTKLYHSPKSIFYSRITPDVWFDSEESADAAGFIRYDRRVSAVNVEFAADRRDDETSQSTGT